MSTIEVVDVFPIGIPLKTPLLWGAAGRIDRLEHAVVRVRTRDGVVGYGEAVPRPMIYGESLVSVVHALRDWFGPAVVGLNCHEPEKIVAAIETVAGNVSAKSALEMAAYDAASRSVGLPLRRYLGGWSDEVEVSYMLSLGSPEKMISEAANIRNQTGIRAFKIKAGQNPVTDLQVVRDLRAELGPDAILYPDFNEQYDLHTAIRVIRQMSEYGIAWVEEPIPVTNRGQRVALARAIPTPILADDSATTLSEAAHEVAESVAGVLCIKIARTGIHQSQRIVTVGAAFGVKSLVGGQGVTDLGTMHSAQFAAAYRDVIGPSDLGNFIKQTTFVLDDAPKIIDGKLRLSDAPGGGFDLNEATLARLAI